MLPTDDTASDAPPPRPLSVLRLYDHLGFEQGVVHGPGRAILRATPALKARGVDTHLAIMAPYHSSAIHFDAAGISYRFLGRKKWDFRGYFDVLKLLRELKPDVLHLGGMKSILLGRLAARKLPVPVIIHLHDTLPFPAPIKLLSRYLVKNTTLCIGVSHHVSGFGRHAFRIPEPRIRTLYNGVKLDLFHPPAAGEREAIRTELGLPADAQVVGMCGRLRAEKSADILVEALGSLVTDFPNLYGLMLGDGPERPILAEQARRIGMGKRLVFGGQRDDMPRVIRALDVLAMPTRAGEGFPNAALEAMATGIPVIGSRFGGLLEVVEQDVNGLLCEPGNATDLARTIRRFFTEPDVRTVLIQNARKSVSGYSTEAYADNQKLYYEESIRLFGEDGGFKPAPGKRLGAAWRKNGPEAMAALRGGFPRFVFASSPPELGESIPVFCYHRINEKRFEEDLKFLLENGYRTAGADEVLRHLRGTMPLGPKTIALTFDDGTRDLYEVAYPLLKAAGLKAIAFVCPGFAERAGAEPPERKFVCDPYQLREMEASGHLDIQSHTVSHRRLPSYPREANLAGVPAWWPRRYRPGATSISDELKGSREKLETWLGKEIRHLCLVQYEGSTAVTESAKTVGYEGFWWSTHPGQPDNLPGKRLDRIVRISGEFIRRLPGNGREPVLKILKNRYF